MRSKERLYVVLNEQFRPPKEFNDGRVIISAPTTVNLYDRNTKATVTGIPGRGYYGEVDVYYNRLPLAEKVPSFSFSSEQTVTKEELIQTIANLHDLDISLDDFDPFTIPVLGVGQSANVTMTAAVESWQWSGSINLFFEHGKTELSVVVGKRRLDVYRHPFTDTTKVKARMLTWGLDFSGIQDAIRPDSKGAYTDWETLRAHCTRLGIPDWIKGTIVDKLTAEVADANPAFERVIIQSSVSSGFLLGPIYLHYNPI